MQAVIACARIFTLINNTAEHSGLYPTLIIKIHVILIFFYLSFLKLILCLVLCRKTFCCIFFFFFPSYSVAFSF